MDRIENLANKGERVFISSVSLYWWSVLRALNMCKTVVLLTVDVGTM